MLPGPTFRRNAGWVNFFCLCPSFFSRMTASLCFRFFFKFAVLIDQNIKLNVLLFYEARVLLKMI